MTDVPETITTPTTPIIDATTPPSTSPEQITPPTKIETAVVPELEQADTLKTYESLTPEYWDSWAKEIMDLMKSYNFRFSPFFSLTKSKIPTFGASYY